MRIPHHALVLLTARRRLAAQHTGKVTHAPKITSDHVNPSIALFETLVVTEMRSPVLETLADPCGN